MKINKWILCLGACALGLQLNAAPMGSAFTYQGRLNSSGGQARDGIYDFRFTLYDAATAGSVVGVADDVSAVPVTNGLFTVQLDFSASPFMGEARWLQLQVNTNAAAPLITLNPRQRLTPTPQAIFAATAANATTAAGVVANAVGPAELANGAVTSAKIADGTIVASDLNASLLGNTFWSLTGNAGTSPGINFLGTTDNQAVEIKVNNQRMLRLEPAFNVIGGQNENRVTAGVSLATIAGGEENLISAHRGVISGGSANSIRSSAFSGVIGGGEHNEVLGAWATIAGGRNNVVSSNAEYSVIAGGLENLSLAQRSVIAGGGFHYIGGTNRAGQTIVGATVGGGYGNAVLNTDATTSGGSFTENSGLFGVIGGGTRNTNATENGTIGGGAYNVLTSQVSGTIAGGFANHNSGWDATIGGGSFNQAGIGVFTVEGFGNYTNSGFAATVAGGQGNRNHGGFGVIAGGQDNVQYGLDFNDTAHGVISGGRGNTVRSLVAGTIGGGRDNLVRGDYATVPGGRQARAEAYGQVAHAAGAFALPGDAQESSYVMRQDTTGTASTEMFLDGGVRRLLVPASSSWMFEIKLTGRRSNGSTVAAAYQGAIKNVGGVVSFVGALNTTFSNLAEIPGAWVSVLDDNIHDALIIRVNGGVAGDSIRWVAAVHASQVQF